MAKSGIALDEARIKEVISDVLSGNEILSIKSEPAVPDGDHYLSTLLRIHVTSRGPNSDEKIETKFILKALPQGVLSEFAVEGHLLLKELITYNKIMPHINKINGKNITPTRFGTTEDDILVLEDLQLKSYKTKNRVEKLDFEHAKEALKLLADFHAASIKVHAVNPELFEEIKIEKLYTDDNPYMRSVVINNFKYAADQFESLPNLRTYSDRLRKCGERIWNDVKAAMVPRQDKINVFNHGDFWTTNIMYSYDDRENIKDIKFIDFQFCRWGSPAFDLQMFYTTSVRDRGSIPKLTSIYLERLNSHLYPDKISKETLDGELRRLDCFSFLTAICVMPICILDPKNPLNFNETTTDDYNQGFPEDRPNPYLVSLKDKGYHKIIPEYLEFYEKMGLF